MKVFIVAKEIDFVYRSVIAKLSELGIQHTDSISDCDMVITIGGDGTILQNGKQAAKARKPLLGINTGRLGFMATLETNELDKLERIKSGNYATSRRMLLDVRIGNKSFQALNDVVLHRGKKSRLPDFSVTRGDIEVMRVRADGIIVATPTGSTAYSLSAGGPIIEPDLECFLVTSLNPHTLFNRPMIFLPQSQLSVFAKEVFVSIDGSDEVPLHEEISISKSQYHLDLIDINGNSFYDSIHNKLMKPLKE